MLKKLGLISLLGIQAINISASYYSSASQNQESQKKYFGVFKRDDKKEQSIRYANWGSRPYEYAWAANIVSIEGKRVLDLGTGLPSSYNWYSYAAINLKPSFYVGIDCDPNMVHQTIIEKNFQMRHMDMSDLKFADKEFDIAYCISTFEHIPYDIFIKCIQEAHRVLKNDGLLILTLDEEWDKDIPLAYENGWNALEISLICSGRFRRTARSFGLPEFLTLVKDYFVPIQDDVFVDAYSNRIVSSRDGSVYYDRKNRDDFILNSGPLYNSCVSFAVLKKKNK